MIPLEKKMFGSRSWTAYSRRVRREPIGTPPLPWYVLWTPFDPPLVLGWSNSTFSVLPAGWPTMEYDGECCPK